MSRTLCFASVLLIAGAAAGSERGSKLGQLVAPAEVDEHLTVLARSGGECAGKGVVCAWPGARSTVVASTGVATPIFARVIPGAASKLLAADAKDHAPWTLEVLANFKVAARPGYVLFILYDAADPNALARHEVAGLYQAPGQGGSAIAARLTLTPNDGFTAGKTYGLRIEQILGKREVVLANGRFILK